MTPVMCSQWTNERLMRNLRRQFKVREEEQVVWRSYNEYSLRSAHSCSSHITAYLLTGWSTAVNLAEDRNRTDDPACRPYPTPPSRPTPHQSYVLYAGWKCSDTSSHPSSCLPRAPRRWRTTDQPDLTKSPSLHIIRGLRQWQRQSKTRHDFSHC